MAATIKGITVEIGGSTIGLQKALAEVNSKSRSLQSELRQVEKLLKLDPSNTELLAQKQKLLGEAVKTTSEKLASLKEAEKQVQAQFKEGKISEEQYRALQREIVKTEQELGRYEGQLSDVANESKKTGDATQDIGKKADETGGKFNMFAFTAGSAIGNLVAEGIKNLLSALADVSKEITQIGVAFYDATNRIEAMLGVTEEEARRFGDIAKNLYTNAFGENVNEIVNDIAILRQNISTLTDTELEGMAEGIYTINDLFGTDFREVTKSAATLMQNFGIKGDQALDIITYGFQNGADKSGDLLDTLNEYSVQFKGMGFDAKTFVGILVNGAKAGAFNVDKVADAVKEFGVRVKDGSVTTDNAFRRMGLQTDDLSQRFARGGKSAQDAFYEVIRALESMEDPVLRNITGVELFGTMWEDVGEDVVLSLDDVTDSFGDMDGAAQKATDNLYDTASVKWESVTRTLKTAFTPAIAALADTLNTKLGDPKVQAAIENISEKIGELASKITDKLVEFLNSDSFSNLAEDLLELSGSIGDALVYFIEYLLPALVDGLKWMVENRETITNVMMVLGAALTALGIATGNVQMALAGVAMVGGSVIGLTGMMNEYLAENEESIKNWSESSQLYVGEAQGFWDNYFAQTANGLLSNVNWLENDAPEALRIWAEDNGIYTSEATAWWDNFKVGTLRNWTETVEGMSAAWNTVKENLENAWIEIKTVFLNAWNAIKENFLMPLKEAFMAIPKAFKEAFTFELPHIKLPHFSINGKFSLDPPSIPTIGVNWYAKGGIFSAPSIIGVGEKGSEAVLPIDRLSGILADALSKMRMNNQVVVNVYPRELSSAQTDYLVYKVNRTLGGLAR
jgi:phage-related minor tail protein